MWFIVNVELASCLSSKDVVLSGVAGLFFYSPQQPDHLPTSASPGLKVCATTPFFMGDKYILMRVFFIVGFFVCFEKSLEGWVELK